MITFSRASELLVENPQRFAVVIAECYQITSWLTQEYPDHTRHFFTKYVPGIFTGEREILARCDHRKVIATAIFKKTPDERKISTLFVAPDFRHQGIGATLLEAGFDWLGTTAPLITIAGHRIDAFAPFIEKYGWVETGTLKDGFYNPHTREHVFNGPAGKPPKPKNAPK